MREQGSGHKLSKLTSEKKKRRKNVIWQKFTKSCIYNHGSNNCVVNEEVNMQCSQAR
jgi:hypothetical protein